MRLTAVSYTHLDVYKRQIQDSSGNSSIDPSELKNGGSLLPLGSDKDHGSHKGYGPVSYTHLDVYKRQPYTKK